MNDRDMKWGSPKNYVIFGGHSHIPMLRVRIFGVLCWDMSVKPNARIVRNKFYV